MKIVTYIICIILMIAGFIFNGELFMLYLDNFQDSYYQATFGIGFTTNQKIDEEMKQDILRAGTNFGVEYFLVDSNINSDGSKSITVYGTDEALADIRRAGVSTRRYRSMFVGDADVKLVGYQKISKISAYQQIYLIGGAAKQQDMDRFKADLVNKYGGGFPKMAGNPMEIWTNLFSAWLMTGVLMVLLLIFKMLCMKKETAVRILLGEDVLSMFYKNAATDAGVITIGFILVPLSLCGATNTYFKIQYIGILFLLLALSSVIINLFIFRVDFKKDLSASRSGRGLFFANYSMKAVTVVLVIFILSGSLIEIAQAMETYRQKDFFEAHRSYCYYELAYVTNMGDEENIRDNMMMNQAFYKRFQNKALRYVDLSGNYNNTYPCVLVNGNAIREISRTNPPVEKAMSEFNKDGYYVLYPEGISLRSEEYQEAVEEFQLTFSITFDQIKPVKYDGTIGVIAMLRDGGSNNSGTKIYRNPILLVNSTRQTTNLEEAEQSSWDYTTMYDISRKDFDSFIQDYQMGNQYVARINVLEQYEQYWAVLLRGMRLTLTLAVFLLLLEMALVLFIIRLEYKLNAIELAIKKVHGYTIFERNLRLVTATLVSGALSVIAVLVVAVRMNIENILYLACVGAVLLLIEMIYIVAKAKRIEAENIPRILKGEMM